MAHRMDAGRTRSLILLAFLCAGAGCATLARREPPPTGAAPPPAPVPQLPSAEPLALASPPRQTEVPPSAVRPATFEEPPAAPSLPPGTSVEPDAPRRLYREAAAAYARQP